MGTTRYYFLSYIEDVVLDRVKTQAVEFLNKNDNIVKIFKANNLELYGQSPRQTLFLMRQNNKSIFSSSPSKEYLGDPKPNQGLFTPPIRNQYSRNIPRRQLSFDDAQKASDSRTSESNTPIRHQSVIVSANDNSEKPANPTDDKTADSDQKLGSPSVSACSPKGSNQESPRSDQKLGSPSVSTCSPKERNQESPRSAEITKMTPNLTMAETKSESPAKMTGKSESSKQESPRSAVINKTTSSPTPISEETKSVLREHLTAGVSFLRPFTPESSGKPGTSDNPDSVSQALVISTVSKPRMFKSETPSPVKKSKMDSTFTLGNPEIPSPAKKFGIADSSPEDTSPIQIDKTDPPPNEENIGIARDDRKRKSLSPKQRSMSIFRSMPRVVKSVEEDIDIEVPFSLEENASPLPSGSSSADYRSDRLKIKIPVGDETKSDFPPEILLKQELSPSEPAISATSSHDVSEKISPVGVETKIEEAAEIDVAVPHSLEENAIPSTSGYSSADCRTDALKVKSPFAYETKADFPNKIYLNRYLSTSETATSATSSDDLSKEKSPVGGETKPDSFQILQRFLSSSKRYSLTNAAVEDRSGDSESGSSNTEIDASKLRNSVLKFGTLLVLREEFLQKTHSSILSFQTGVELVLSYVGSAKNIATTIASRIKENVSKEFKDSVNSAITTAAKLQQTLMQWKRDLWLDVATWHKSFDLIQQEKVKYGPLLTNEGKPRLSVEDMQKYERKIKDMWKTLDDIILISDSRRALFSNIGYDIVKLMQNVVRSLILVGILLPR